MRSALAENQKKFFRHRYRTLLTLLGDGHDLVDALNVHDIVCVRFNPDYIKEQLFLTLRTLIHHQGRLKKGAIVICEEFERLGELGELQVIQEFIMAGRKRHMYLVLVSHMDRGMLRNFLGPAYYQFDCTTYFEPGGKYTMYHAGKEYRGIV